MIVVFGGAFNPPTLAHLEIINYLVKLEDVNKVIIVPVGDMYEKLGLINATHRLKMLEIMTEEIDKVDISTIEIDAPHTYKTIETMNELQKVYPREKLAFVIGADNLEQLDTWSNYETLLENFNIFILNRNKIEIKSIIDCKFLKFENNFRHITDVDIAPISSTVFRSNSNKTGLVHEFVAAYIKKHRLYTGEVIEI